MTLNSTFSDANASFNKNSYPVITDLDSIYQAIYCLLHTRKGESMFNPTKGVNIEDLLFKLSPNDTMAMKMAFFSILKDLESQEPRIKVDYSKSQISTTLDNYSAEIEIHILVPMLGLSGVYREIINYGY